MSNKTKTTELKKAATPARVPRLRFPEFLGTDEWKIKLLGELFADRQEAGLSGLPLLSLMDKKGIVPQEVSNRKNNSNSDKSKYLRVVPGDIAYNTMRMWEGRSALVGLEGLVSPAYTVCEPKPGVHSLLFSYYFKTPQLIEQFRRFSQGLVKDTLNLKYPAFAQISAIVPTYPEQQKIAECLSSVDELIAAQACKIDALKIHKKGLMQQLFPREGETQPCFRFPKFQNAGEWKKNKLGDIASFYKGKGISKDDIAANGRYPCIRYGELYTRYDEVISDIISRTNVADADLFFSQSNDVIIPASGETKLDIAKASCVMCEGVALGGDLNVIRTDHNGIFLSYYLNGPKRLDIAKVAQGDTVVHLYPSQLMKLDVFLPEINEQQSIATCLGRLDVLISMETQKLVALKTHKKGLMQKLFPSMEDAR